MHYAQFLATIRNSGGFDADHDDGNHADQATIATLSILGQQLAGNESRHLAAQLPIELQELLTQRDGDHKTDKDGEIAVDVFLFRIADEEGFGCETDQARAHAKAVLSTLAGSLSSHESAVLRAQLPAGYATLFDIP